MKLRNLCIIALSIILIACNTSKTNFKGLESTTVNGVEIPIIRLDLAPENITEINLSQLVSEINVIPLETKKECLIAYAFPHISDEYLFVWTSSDGKPYLYKFDYKGKFIHQIGKHGKGPGEFSGYGIRRLQSFDNYKQIAVQSEGGVDHIPSIYQYNGNYLHNIILPYYRVENFNRLNDSLWFTVGDICGASLFKTDSIMLAIFTKSGKVIKEFPREKYASAKRGKFLPFGGMHSVYFYKTKWKLYNPGNDTLFYINIDKLTPAAIFTRGEKGSPYNQNINPDDIKGKYDFKIIRETENYLIVLKELIRETNLKEFSIGSWSIKYFTDNFIIIIDKITGKLHNIRIKDDILGIFDEGLFTEDLTISKKGIFNWEKGIYSGSKQALDLKEEITEALKKDDLSESTRIRLTKLKANLSDEDNPVVFRFILKDRLEL